jgi:hypothetical protein
MRNSTRKQVLNRVIYFIRHELTLTFLYRCYRFTES